MARRSGRLSPISGLTAKNGNSTQRRFYLNSLMRMNISMTMRTMRAIMRTTSKMRTSTLEFMLLKNLISTSTRQVTSTLSSKPTTMTSRNFTTTIHQEQHVCS